MTNNEYILGALYGHAYGDASGARLEFLGHTPSQKEVDEAMSLNGGGVWKVAPGQATDDTELTIQSFKALVNYKNQNVVNQKSIDYFIAKMYKEWFDSVPFDIGMTTRNAFHGAVSASDMRNNVKILNFMSESNGALMRCIPLAIYAYKNDLSLKDIYHLVKNDVNLTHCKKTVVNIVFVYVYILIYLFENDGEIKSSFETQLFEIAKSLGDKRLDEMLDDNYSLDDCTLNPGWDKHAFSLTLFCLKNNLNFQDSIKYVLSLGGDTDTNAAIVGGVIGARFGIENVPLVDKIINCKVSHGRSAFHPKIYRKLLNKL